PVNGMYNPGQTVTFCYYVNNYNQLSNTWFHSVVVSFGNGWDLSSIIPIPPASCDGTGSWGWYTNVTSSNSGQTFPYGFFYEQSISDFAVPSNPFNPGDNWGDNCTNHTWQFCLKITAASCASAAGSDLSITFRPYGDSYTGGYNPTLYGQNVNCASEQPYVFNATLQCMSAVIDSMDVSCNGLCDGAADLTVVGGTPPYTYAWTGGYTTEDLNGLCPGTYSVTVTDNTGYTVSASVNIDQPAPLSVNGTVADVRCFNGSDGAIDLTVSGGTPPYAFLWSNSVQTEDISGLTVGNYSVTVTDTHNCQATLSFQVNQPTPIQLSHTVTDVRCNGGFSGAIDLSAAGGTFPYQYLWSNNATTQDITGLQAGTYTVTLTDANGCTATRSATVNEPPPLTFNFTGTDASCYGASDGMIDLTVTGGVGPYAYQWSGGVTTEDLTGIPAGTYTVSVTDNNGCIGSGTYSISQPSQILISAAITDVFCNGGSDGAIDITVTGGAGGYQYQWSNAATTEDISNLPAGNYTV
ncbi:MAG: hypothetical protein D6706_12915, partial [Chloroflexi bacterium]